MSVTVLDSKDLITHLTTGETPIPKEVAEDNARKAAAEAAKTTQTTPKQSKVDQPTGQPEKKGDEGDDIEGEDGLTPRQKRDFSAAMLKSIGKKHREKLEAEEFAAAQYNNARLAEQRAENLERQLAELKSQQQPVKPVEAPKKPERTNFETDEAYQDALVDFRVKETLAKEKREEADRAAQNEQAEIARVAGERLRKAAELVPDFVEKTENAELRIPGHIAGYMRESELFAELGYHFADHPDIVERLAKLSPAKALVEVGKIESTLQPFSSRSAAGSDGKANGQKPSTSETESAKTTTAASGNGADPGTQTESTQSGASPSKPRGTAPVITPLSAGSTSQVEKPSGERNIREEIAAWQQKNQRNLGLRKRH